MNIDTDIDVNTTYLYLQISTHKNLNLIDCETEGLDSAAYFKFLARIGLDVDSSTKSFG
tara:strand:+ start:2530 stop:2706 length:177 start_codon:yes stop_codon:yes gene_type:complete